MDSISFDRNYKIDLWVKMEGRVRDVKINLLKMERLRL